MIGYGVMSLVMTATPLAMVECGFTFGNSAFVIQCHALGMFLPSFFTGHLIARFGVLKVMMTGAVLFAGCVAINLSGVALWQFWSALILLGLGWNFLYIGGSTLLTEAYLPEERAKTQAVNDCLVFGMVTVATFASGALHHHYGWNAVNLGVIVPVTTRSIHDRLAAAASASGDGVRPSESRPERRKTGPTSPLWGRLRGPGQSRMFAPLFSAPGNRRAGRFPRDGWTI